MEKGNVVTLVLNLYESIDTLTVLIKAMDAVHFTVGSRENECLEQMLLVQLNLYKQVSEMVQSDLLAECF